MSDDELAEKIMAAANDASAADDEYCTWSMAQAALNALREAIPGLDALIAGTGVVPTVEMSSEAFAAITALPPNKDGRPHLKSHGLERGVFIRYPHMIEAAKGE